MFTGSTLLTRLGGFLLIPLYWQRLTPDDYGILAVVAVVGAFQVLFSTMAADLSITRFYYEWPEAERRRNLGAIWSWNWINAVVWAALFLLVLPRVSEVIFPDVPYHPYLMLGLIGNSLSSLFVVPARSIRIKRLPWLFAGQSLLHFLLTSGLGIWFVVVRDEGLEGLLWATIWANLLMAAFGAGVMLRFSQPCFSAPGLRQAIRFSLPAVPSNLVSVIGGVLDRLLLTRFSTLETLGIYAVSMRFVDVIGGGLHGSLKMAYGPFMMKHLAGNRAGGRAIVVSMTPYYMLPYFAAALGLILFVGPFVRLIGQPEYFPVVQWVPWLAGVAILNCLYFYYANGMFLGNRTDLLIFPAATQLSVMLVSSIYLIPPYQLAGLVASRYLSAGVFFGLSLALSQRMFHLPHRWGTLAALAAGTVAFALAGALLDLSSPVWEIALKLPVLALFVLMCYRLVAGEPAGVT